MLRNTHIYAVEGAPPVPCSGGGEHYLHIGLLSVAGASQAMGVMSGPERLTPSINLERYIKGPWAYNDDQSAIRLRNPIELDARDTAVLGSFASHFGIDWAVQYPTIGRTTITVQNRSLVIPYKHGPGETLVFETDTPNFMMAAVSALGVHRIITAN